MTATGYTSGDPSKVSRTGDTMTGDLTMSGTAGVIDTFAGITGDIMEYLASMMSTGIVSGGVLSINAGDPTLVDISAVTGWIVDYDAHGSISATNPKLTKITWAGATGVALTGPVTQPDTWWLLDSSLTLIQQATPPTPAQHRSMLTFGRTVQVGGTNVIAQPVSNNISQPLSQFVDLADALRPFSLSHLDNTFTANGVNLMLDKTSGQVFARGYGADYTTPNLATQVAQSPVTFRHATATMLQASATAVDVGNYDPGAAGVVTPIGGGANVATIFRIYILPTTVAGDQVFIQYGQNTYASLSAAVAAIGTGDFQENELLFSSGTLVAYLAVIRTATDLSDPSQASITHAGRFAHP